MKPVMKINAEKLCCFWFIHFCYCSSCCLSLSLFFFCLFYFSYFLLFCFDYYFLFKPTAILEKSYTLTQTLPFFFPLYVGQPVRTTAAPGRLF